MGDTVRAEFDATLEELADVGVRLNERSRVSRSSRRQAIVLAGLIGGAAAYVVLDVIFSVPPAARVILSAAVGCVVAFFSAQRHDGIVRQRYRKYCAERLGDRTSAHCEIEPRTEGLYVRQDQLDMTFSWEGIETIEDGTEDLVFTFRQGLVVVRGRAFSTPAERTRFVTKARTLSEGRA